MQKNEKSKKERLKKLHLILDNPSSKDLHPEDEKYLKALSKRLEESSKESIIYIQRSAKKDGGEEIDPLKPRVTIHHKEEKESVVHVKQEEPEERKESLFEDENLYEVEKVEVKGPEFLEVKPREISKEEKLESETSGKKKYTEDTEHQELPEWEPVDIKKIENKVEETKAARDAERKAQLEAKRKEQELAKQRKQEEILAKKKAHEETKEEKSESKDELPLPVEEKTEFKEEELPPTEKREKEKKEFSPDTQKTIFLTPDSPVPDVGRDSKIDVFRDIESIDEKTAVLLYDNGFTSIDAVKKASLKDLTRINGVKRKLAKNIKKEIEEKLESVASENEDGNKVEEFGEYFLIDEKIEEDETRKVDKSISKHDFVEEDEGFFEEEKEKEIAYVEKDEKTDVFKGISSIDEKTASLLYENGITSVDILREIPIKKLTKIKGIKRKLAKEIKKETNEIVKKNEENIDYHAVEEDDLFIEEDVDEWDSYEEDEIPEQKVKEVKGYRHGDYTLYKKEIELSSGKKRTVHFFSKAEPDEGVPVESPAGFEIKVNKKTGVPYLRKKSKKK